ncbi:MAG: redoxin domain-containing protein [Sedimentisphaerales bacterium]|nr:redoxin domain-containing protein [Sedimentisphaerales bacterium]
MNWRRLPMMIILAVLMGPFTVLAQDDERPGRPEMRDRRNMSEAEREEFRARMRERFDSRPPVIDREEQLEAIKIIEEQLAKLKTFMEATSPENRNRFRDLPAEERAALREKMITAMRERQRAVRTMEEELEKLKGPRLPEPDPRERIEELRAIHEMAVKENASETAKRLEGLIASFERESRRDRWRPEPQPRGDMERPRPDRPPRWNSGERAKPFTLTGFDGKTVNLADYRGKTVVLEWFNLECPFVRYHYEKASTMIDLANKYKDQNVVWLAINSTNHTTPEANTAFAAKHNLPYPILDDRAGTVGRAYGAKTTPHLFIISPHGQIVYNGAIDNSPMGTTPEGEEKVNYVDNVLAALAANKDIDVRETKSYGCSVKYAQ